MGREWKEWGDRFYQGKAWRECRKGFMQSKNYICEICKGVATIAHHKEHLTPQNINDPNITLNWDLLQALCIDCHNKVHGNNDVTAEGLIFDEEGNLKEI